MAYADYTFYTEVYGGSMSLSEFNKYSPLADMHIDDITQGNAVTAPTSMVTRLRYASCNYVDFFKKKKENEDRTQGGIITSESNDGFSQSYASPDTLKTEQDETDKTIAKTFLVSPYNLLYGGR